MSPRALSVLTLTAVFSFLLCLPATADSHVRIVRLSYIEGTVQVDRNTGQFVPAIVNLPIVEGTKLRTGTDGRAEVEFENGGTLRLGADTAIQFTNLSLRDNGTKVSTVQLNGGTEYADFEETRGNYFTLQFAGSEINLTQPAHLRIVENNGETTVAVIKGNVRVKYAADGSETALKKNETATFGSGNAVVAKNVAKLPLDSWDKQQSQYHERFAVSSYSDYSPYAYGTSDLAYYGSFMMLPGYGMMWQPYFVGTGWDPFIDGAWAFSPGFGYGWVSGYPWGWLPYHYGAWRFVPGYGWMWQPGGAWMPWYSQPVLYNAPHGFVTPRPPTTVAAGIVTVNRGPALPIGVRSGNKIMIRNNSAGLGIPRGRVANLAAISRDVQRQGAVTENVHRSVIARPMPPFAGSEMGRNPEWGRGTGSGRSGDIGSGHPTSMSRPAPSHEPPMGGAQRSPQMSAPSAPQMSPPQMSAPESRGGGVPHR